MKNLILTTLLLGASLIASASSTIHVYSTEIPWSDATPTQESGKIYSITAAIAAANAGDSIIIHEGIYREQITITKNNLKFANYGNDYVLVTGADLVSGWSAASGMASGIMEANISGLNIETDYSQLFSDGAIQQMGRFPNNTTGKMMEPMDPNSGYGLLKEVSKRSGEGADCFAEFEEAPPVTDLTGGIIRGLVGKNRHYFFGNITNNTRTGNITFKAINNGQWKDEGAISDTYHKFGYSFIYHKNLIDIPGEWFIDGSKLYYMPKTDNVNNERVEIQTREYVLRIDNKDGTSIDGINFSAGLIRIEDADNNSITNSSFRYLSPFFIPNGYGMNESGAKGFYVENCDNNLIENCYLAHNWGNMLTLRDCNNSTINNCVIKDFGWVAIFTAAVYLRGSAETTLTNSTLAEGARFLIRIDGTGNGKLTMTDNDLYDAMKMGEDAGPIEATSTGRIGALNMSGSEIAYNKVRDCYGLPVSAGGYLRQKITAFYMEDVENYTAHHNLVYNFLADNYTGEYENELEKHGEFLYLGPRYNPMYHPVNYYNNTVWDVNQIMGVWNIEINNWKELGLSAPDTTGFMRDGHFANNIIISGPEYKMSYVRQNISATGANKGYVTLSPSPSYYSSNFADYAAKAKPLGYEFNPENNVFFTTSVGNRNFVSTRDADYRLQETSTAKGAGIPIEGITSSDTPDCGAFEGSDRVMYAGSELETPEFKEDKSYNSTALSEVETIDFMVFPNPTDNFLTVALEENRPAKVSLFNLSGKQVVSQVMLKRATIDLSSLSAGIYFVKVKTDNAESVKPVIIK